MILPIFLRGHRVEVSYVLRGGSRAEIGWWFTAGADEAVQTRLTDAEMLEIELLCQDDLLLRRERWLEMLAARRARTAA